ncbi:MAG TPA: Bax inhibitor-1/YccA family protein [Marmoricola sp.]|jgi:uncharacterized YccA/Bax inhibitor family protein|nr:Bax inhibitor-1/YccA family protein [Marmoricola sp.]
MQSNNPVFANNDGFNGKNAGGYASFDSSGISSGYATGPMTHTGAGVGPMTIDTVVQKTGLTLGTVVVAAALTWVLTGDPTAVGTSGHNASTALYGLAGAGALGGFALAMVNSFKKVISPALVIGYAGLEGVFIGAMSKVYQEQFGSGVVPGAVLGTVAAVAGTLAAYRFFDIKVSNKFRTWVIGMMFGFVALSMLDFVLGIFGSNFGFNEFGGLGLLSSVFGLGLGIMMLILDFDFIEKGIAAGLPERESWRGAFGLTVTIVWIYLEILRILSIFGGRR